MQIANDITHRIVLEEGKDRRRKLMQMFYKYIAQDVTILPTYEYNNLTDKIKKLETQLKLINEMRQAEQDRLDIHRRV